MYDRILMIVYVIRIILEKRFNQSLPNRSIHNLGELSIVFRSQPRMLIFIWPHTNRPMPKIYKSGAPWEVMLADSPFSYISTCDIKNNSTENTFDLEKKKNVESETCTYHPFLFNIKHVNHVTKHCMLCKPLCHFLTVPSLLNTICNEISF